MKEILKDFTKALVDQFPLGDNSALKIFEFYKSYDQILSKEQVVNLLKDICTQMERSDFSNAVSGSSEQILEDGAKVSIELAVKLLK